LAAKAARKAARALSPEVENLTAMIGNLQAAHATLPVEKRSESARPNARPVAAGTPLTGAEQAALADLFGPVPDLPAEGWRALLLALEDDWRLSGRFDQQAPLGDWRTWLLMGGRGSGKTRAGAEWVAGLASARPVRIALVAETLAEAREVMIDGISGILRVSRRNRPEFEISRRRLVWPNGSVAQVFSAEDPESLRGPQFDYAWCDEIAKWPRATETWDMLQFGLRLGSSPRQLVTTTPRSTAILKRLIADPETVTTRLSTRANAANLAPGFIAAIEARYGGTRLGRQELDGELLADREDAFWTRDQLDALRLRTPVPLSRIVVAVDPPANASAAGSCCGIVVAGTDGNGRAVVLADCSLERASPAEWAQAVVRAYNRFQADRVVAEINQGGDMVTARLRSADLNLPIATVRATRGKVARAEPVAALYEQGRVAHAAGLMRLEDQMCDFGPDGMANGTSPDRLDALVWALSFLMLGGQGEPRVRGM
jgi:phage terminase large subunit-like protein